MISRGAPRYPKGPGLQLKQRLQDRYSSSPISSFGEVSACTIPLLNKKIATKRIASAGRDELNEREYHLVTTNSDRHRACMPG